MEKEKTFEGRYSLGKNGIAYIKNKDTGDIIEVQKHNSGTALSRDIVRVKINDIIKKEGEVISIIERAKTGFVGVIKKHNNKSYIFNPDDFKIPEIIIPKTLTNNAKENEKVYIEIEKYEPILIGRVIKRLGDPNSNDANINGIALEQGFDFSFPSDVEKEAEMLEKKGIIDDDFNHRRDMRNHITFTIDPEDAKDFDDALSFNKIDEKTYEIGIHIADVSHFVKPNSNLDKEAQNRTTSVYLVDRTIPMLPESISNVLCSIRENEEKLTFSVVFKIDKETGEIKDEWYGKTIIKSNKRFTYEEAQKILDEKSGLYFFELKELNKLSKIFENKRYKNGALNFETHEIKFILDEKGKPISVKVKERKDIHKLIEEFMLLANNSVAKYMSNESFFVYRVHEKPDIDKMKKLKDFLSLLNYNITLKEGMIPVKIIQKIIKEAEGSSVYDTLQTAVVRSMQKAIYTTKNIGHFGLAFKYYTHFTSPIRRYPDILVHRLLQAKLRKNNLEEDQSWYEKMCIRSSEKEQSAVTAERNSIKLKQVEYMATKNLDEIFNGIVTGTGKFGVFVAEEKSKSEGMIRLRDLGDDFFKFNEKTGAITGKNTKISFKLGDKIKIKIKEVNLRKRLIDYYLIK